MQQVIDKRKIRPLGSIHQMTSKQRKFLKRRKVTHGYFDPRTQQFVVQKFSNDNIVFLCGRGCSSMHWNTISHEETTQTKRDIEIIARTLVLQKSKFGPLKHTKGMTEVQRKWIFRNIGSSIGAYFDEENEVFVVRTKGKGSPQYYCGFGTEKRNWKRLTIRQKVH